MSGRKQHCVVGPAATIRALNTAIQTLKRTDVVDSLMTLTPLFRYVNASDNNNDDLPRDLVLQGHQGQGHQGQGQGRQRPVSSSSKK